MFPFAVRPWQVQQGALPEHQTVDLREARLFERGHLSGAINLPYNDFQELALDRLALDRPVLVVDPAGARAAEMATWLRARGVQAGYLEGGMAAWTGPLSR